MKNSFLILNELIENISNFHGIVAYSLFLMPVDDIERIKLLKK